MLAVGGFAEDAYNFLLTHPAFDADHPNLVISDEDRSRMHDKLRTYIANYAFMSIGQEIDGVKIFPPKMSNTPATKRPRLIFSDY